MSDSVETRVKELETAQDGIEHFLFGNGQPGFVAEMRAVGTDLKLFIAEYKATETERTAVVKRRNFWVNVFIGVATLFVLSVTAVAAVLALHAAQNHSLLENLNLSTSQYQYTIAERSTK